MAGGPPEIYFSSLNSISRLASSPGVIQNPGWPAAQVARPQERPWLGPTQHIVRVPIKHSTKLWNYIKFLNISINKLPSLWNCPKFLHVSSQKLSNLWNCLKFLSVSIPKPSKLWNCPKKLEILNVNVVKVWNCPKKPKKLNISKVLAQLCQVLLPRLVRYWVFWDSCTLWEDW